MSQTESGNMEAMEANSAIFINPIECGGSDGSAFLALLLIILLLAAAAN
jgi:hypothetical protein